MTIDDVELAERLVRIEENLDGLRIALTQLVTEVKENGADQERRIRRLEEATARHSERLGLVAGGLAILQIITSVVAAWVGASR